VRRAGHAPATTSGTAPPRNATVAVPHAIASIITIPNAHLPGPADNFHRYQSALADRLCAAGRPSSGSGSSRVLKRIVVREPATKVSDRAPTHVLHRQGCNK
jgi:hypothetical protein